MPCISKARKVTGGSRGKLEVNVLSSVNPQLTRAWQSGLAALISVARATPWLYGAVSGQGLVPRGRAAKG